MRGAEATGAAHAFLDAILGEFPRFRIVYKRESAFSRLIHLSLLVVTAGGQRGFLTEFYTVIGDTLYVPDSWDALDDDERLILLRHERVHLRQRRRYGSVGMALLYLLPFFPLGLAYGRARLEWEAYAETLRATLERKGRDAAFDPRLRERIVSRFTGPAYGWMWPFRRDVERWYDSFLALLDQEDKAAGASSGRSPAIGSELLEPKAERPPRV
jgi:hypothetical protein